MNTKIDPKVKSLVIGLVVTLALAVLTIPALAITWGEIDYDNTYNNVGSIVIRSLDGSEYFQFCSGTLIHRRGFLTAGHCTDYLEELIDAGTLDPERIFVSFEPDLAIPDLPVYKAQQLITHPYYGAAPNEFYDIGLVILDKPAKHTPLADLPTANYLDDLHSAGRLREKNVGAEFLVVGYGVTLSWPPHEFEDNMLRRYAYSEFISLGHQYLRMSQNLNHDNAGTCFGDSGGPTFWEEEDGSLVLVALTATGDGACMATGFAYRVDLPSSLEFIQDSLDPVR
jgi:hypothetical protein